MTPNPTTDTPTPRTDEQAKEANRCGDNEVVPAEFARTLERELALAIALLQEVSMESSHGHNIPEDSALADRIRLLLAWVEGGRK